MTGRPSPVSDTAHPGETRDSLQRLARLLKRKANRGTPNRQQSTTSTAPGMINIKNHRKLAFYGGFGVPDAIRTRDLQSRSFMTGSGEMQCQDQCANFFLQAGRILLRGRLGRPCPAQERIFQSTLPVGGTTLRPVSLGTVISNFNPRSPWGGATRFSCQ